MVLPIAILWLAGCGSGTTGGDAGHGDAGGTMGCVQAVLSPLSQDALAPCAFISPSVPSNEQLAIVVSMNEGIIEIRVDPANGWSYSSDMSNIVLHGAACTDLLNGTYSNLVGYLCPPNGPIDNGPTD